MLPVMIKPDVYWVGAVDFDKRDFHGYSRSPLGTTYNAYCIKDEKNVVFDSVDEHYTAAFLSRLSQVLPLEKVDYIVCNHLELDHAGSLKELVERCKPEKIFCSTMGLKSIQGYFDTTAWPIQTVKTGDSISIGSRTIHFVETRMLHWPDSMVSYIAEEKMLISNDAFGQNIATTARYFDEIKDTEDIVQSIEEYFYNIVLPFSPQVLKTLDTLAEMKLDIELIAPDHGVIFRRPEDVRYILQKYRELATQKAQQKALILFDSMWGSTKEMAFAVATGLEECGVNSRIMSTQGNTRTAIMTELARCGALVLGSATHNNGILPDMAQVLTYMKGLRPQNRIGAVFGSYGWSGESVKVLGEWLDAMHIEQVATPVKTIFRPDPAVLEQCVALGKSVGTALLARCQ